MASRTNFNQVVQAKRKIGWMEIVGNLIIWLTPIIMMIFIVIYNWKEFCDQEVGFHIEFWMTFVLIIMIFVYLKWGRRKIHEQYVADKSRAEKHHPLLVLGNAFLNLSPFIVGICLSDILTALGEPVKLFLIVLLIVEAIGRLFLFIDSFIDEQYK